MLIVGFSTEKINNLKKRLLEKFAIMDLGATKQILGMKITRDKANATLKLSQIEYVKKVLSSFNMNENGFFSLVSRLSTFWLLLL